MMTFQRIVLGWFAVAVAVSAVATAENAEYGANPLRKVVTLLQNMQKETEAEGDRSQELFDTFQCYCTKTESELSKSIEEAKSHVDELKASIEEISGSNAQLEQELKDLGKDIAAATKSIEEASAQRKTEANAYASESTEMSNSIGAMDSAIPALKEGLETPAAVFAQLNAKLGGMSTKSARVSSFLQNQDQLAGGGSDAILGVLEQMRDDFKQNLIEATQQEEESLETFKQLTGAKKKEIGAGTEETNEKSGRLAGQKQQGADNKADLEDTSVSLAGDEKTFVALTENCKAKTAEHEAAKNARNEELGALGQAVKILGSDEALELMKKTLPSPEEAATSFIQRASRRHHIRNMMSNSRSSLTFAQVSMHTNHAGIDISPLKKQASEMIVNLQEEQKDEDTRIGLCKKELDTTADEKKALSTALLQAESRMGVIANEVAAIKEQMKEVQAEIAQIDTSVQEATLQRKKEKAEFTAVMSELTMSSDLLLKARQVLEKMYAPPAEEKKEAFVQESATFDDSLENYLSSAPETAGAHQKQSGAGMGAVGLLSTLVAEIKAQQAAETKEEDGGQAEFDKYMGDTTEALEAKKNDMTSMEAAVSRLQETMNDQKTVHGETQDEMSSVVAKEAALHSECDFLLQNYDEIKKARGDEIESINNAISILAGADFGKGEEGFLQHRQ